MRNDLVNVIYTIRVTEGVKSLICSEHFVHLRLFLAKCLIIRRKNAVNNLIFRRNTEGVCLCSFLLFLNLMRIVHKRVQRFHVQLPSLIMVYHFFKSKGR